jgi:predicted Na+-dependent transporter
MLLAYATFMRERYAYVIVSSLILGIAVGIFTVSPGQFIRSFSSPLIVIMIGAMGFTITFKTLKTAAKDWGPFSFGLVLNFLFAPFLCWVLALLFLKGHPDFATGLILIGVVPCAGMALVWAGLLKGDVPLATVVNAATMIVAPFLIPFLMQFFAGTFVAIDTLAMFRTVMLTILLPVIGGIILRELAEPRMEVKKYLPLMPAISATAAVLIMFMAVNTAVPLVMKNLSVVGPLTGSTIFVFPVLFLVAYLISKRLLPRGKNIAITFSSGMKNLPIALGIAVVSFKGLVMLPVAVAFAFQMLTAVCFYQFFLKTLPAGPGGGGAPKPPVGRGVSSPDRKSGSGKAT